MEETLHFGVEGEFITDLAREWFYEEGKSLDTVFSLLLNCMGGTDLSLEARKRYAEDVLLGRAAFTGNTADGTFSLTCWDPKEQPDVPDRQNLFLRFGSKQEEYLGEEHSEEDFPQGEVSLSEILACIRNTGRKDK